MGDAAHAMVPFYGQGMNCVSYWLNPSVYYILTQWKSTIWDMKEFVLSYIHKTGSVQNI